MSILKATKLYAFNRRTVWYFNYKEIKKKEKGTSLVIQWLRFWAPKEEGWVPSLVEELDPTCRS